MCGLIEKLTSYGQNATVITSISRGNYTINSYLLKYLISKKYLIGKRVECSVIVRILTESELPKLYAVWELSKGLTTFLINYI